MWFYKDKGEINTILSEMGNKVEICLRVLGNTFCLSLTMYMGKYITSEGNK